MVSGQRAQVGPPGPERGYRGLWAAGIVGAGILLAHAFGGAVHSAWLFAFGASFGAGAIAVRGRGSLALLGASAALASGAWATARLHETSPDHVSRVLSGAPALVEFEGRISGRVRSTDQSPGALGRFASGGMRTSFVLDVDRVLGPATRRASGRVWVWVNAERDGLEPGQRVRVLGFGRGLQGASNPGEFDLGMWARSRGYAGSISVKSPDAVEVLEPAGTSFVGRFVGRARAWIDEQIVSRPRDERTRDALGALLLGERDAGYGRVQAAFARSGVTHVLAISGLHLVIVAGLGAMAVRAGGLGPRWELLIVGAFIVLYIAIVPVRAPIMRAGLMALAFLLPRCLGRRYDTINLLGWVMVVVLLWQPSELFSPGFQLSFGIVGALILFGDGLRNRMFGARVPRDEQTGVAWIADLAKDGASASVCAWLVAMPVVIVHFGVVSLVAPLMTLIVLPLVAMALATATLSLIVSLFIPWLGAPIGVLSAWLGGAVAEVSFWSATLDLAGVYLPVIHWLWAIPATGALCLWLWGRGFPVLRLASSAVALVWLCAALVFTGLPGSQSLRIDTLDVGDGSCHLVRSGRSAVLIDCGSLNLGIGERTIPRAVRALGARSVPSVILTHANIDHYAGILDIARPLGVQRVLLTDAFLASAERSPGGPEAFVLEELDRRGIKVERVGAGDSIELGRARLSFLWPDAGVPIDSPNDTSIVTLIETGSDSDEVRVLMTADIERLGLDGIRAALGGMRIDVMEAPHHGSARPEAIRFVAEIDPSIVVQSTGERRLDDNRWDEVRAGREWLVTARDGAVSVIVRSDGSIETRTTRR